MIIASKFIVDKFNLIVVLGSTATGKTKLAVEIAHKLKSEIISADSRQVYIGMDIGTGKDLDEYRIDEEQSIPYHLINIISPKEEFDVFQFQKAFNEVFRELSEKLNVPPILCGGTGMYLDAVLNSYNFKEVPINKDLRSKLNSLSISDLCQRLKNSNSDLHNTTDLTDRSRMIRAIEIAETDIGKPIPSSTPQITPIIFGIDFDRDIIKKRITQRLKDRLNDGMIDEVKGLVKSGVSFEKLDFFGLEYRFIGQFLQGKIKSRNDLFQKLNSAIHKFSKKQSTWFRKMERNGAKIIWLDGNTPLLPQAEKHLLGFI